MIRELVIFAVLGGASTAFSQGQFAGFYKGQVFFKTITSGVVSQEILQGSVNLTVDGQGKLVSEGVAFLTGQVDSAGDIVFEENGFSFETGKIEDGKMTAIGTLENPGQTLIYRLDAPLSVPPPEINLQPESQTVIAGAKVTFNVSARNAGTFQWRKDGVEIDGATQSSLVLDAVTADDAATYTVMITNDSGSVTSSGAVLTVTAASDNPSWNGRQFRKIADTNTEVPDGEGTFSSFWTPYLGADAVYFIHSQNLDRIGIYGYSDAGLFKVIDRTDLSIPDGWPTGLTLGLGPNAVPGRVIFTGGNLLKLYQWSAGELAVLADWTTEIPGGGGTTLTEITQPISGNGRILFRGSDSGPSFEQPLFILEEGVLSYAAKQEEIPRESGLEGVTSFTPIYNSFDYDGDSFAVLAQGPLNYSGVFASFDGGPLVRIFDSTQNFPGTEIPMGFHTVQIDGGWVYSGAQGTRSSEGFLIRGNGEQTEVLISPETRMPDGILGKIVSPAFSDLDADSGRVLFTAGSNRGAYGIFSWENGEFTWLLSRDDRFDGRAPHIFLLWPHCVRGDDMLIQVNFDFTGNDTALYTTKVLADPDFTSFAVTGIDHLENGYVRLTMETPPGIQYRVQYSDDLADWMDAASAIAGTGFEETWVDSGPPETGSLRAANSSRFYRVVELP